MGLSPCGTPERGMTTLMRKLPLIALWTVVLGVGASLIADGGEWDRFLPNLLWRLLIVAVGATLGLLLNYFASNYVTMGTNVFESMGLVKFSEDRDQKIQNAFIFMGALTAAILAMIFIT